MKTTLVPAQITTVEDKVAGNLSLSQLVLLAAPVFIGSAIYIALPPSLGICAYKLVLMALIAAFFALLAIRIKGKILLLWVIMISRYNLRPRFYLYDKNDSYLRSVAPAFEAQDAEEEVSVEGEDEFVPAPVLSIAEAVFFEEIIASPKAKLHFKTDRKGGLSVRITEIK